ncbi:MAG: CotH kinase family protein [Proteobacteria bacterium]|nr:CotH kinase family protein [Pseudomonadota bacterium]
MRKLTITLVILTINLSSIFASDSSEAGSTELQGNALLIPTICSLLLPDNEETEEYTDTDFDTVDWDETTHSKSADPDFDEVFDSAQVKRLDFVITAKRWQSMLDNMTDLYGEFGQGPSQGFLEDVEDPIFVPAEVFYNDTEWYRVGIRFKGNSSLQSSWQMGILKLSFKLDFDEFEDYYPQIDNQRFYGFKKLSLKNNYQDKSLLREKVAADVFASAGLAVSHTAFYALYIDHGDGSEYFGLYTLVEEVDDTVLDTQFASDDGNLYKPEDGSANFVEGTFNEEDFVKKTNEDEDEEDWTDIEDLFSALHSAERLSAPGNWRTELESVFNVDLFLKYLAVNGIIQNWDSYGRMSHNFFLYNDPDSEITWIPWDHNETLQEGQMGGALALDFSNIEIGGWPLIEKIYADATYKDQYDKYVLEVIQNGFKTETIQALYDTYSELVEPYALIEREGYSFLRDPFEFYQAIVMLKQHAVARAAAVDAYLPDDL